MAERTCLGVFIFILGFSKYLADDGQRLHRFEYKYSFKGPHLINKQGEVPFWTVGGSAIPSSDQVRVTPSLKDKRGFMWTKNQFSGQWFEIEAAVKVTGQGRVGADGLAIWFTETQGADGPVFGSSNPWNGLGILLDSFDNDAQNNNPFISIIVNDGTKIYEHHSDGGSLSQGGCLRNFRNRPHPVMVKVRYIDNVLTVWFHQGMSKKPDYELCTRVEDVHLPKKGVFGVSAATGGLADDHDALSFITHSISTLAEQDEKKKMSEDERKRLSDQYDQMAEKFEKEKEEYAKVHPTKPIPDQQYETSYDRDLRLIYEGQNALHHIVNNLHQKTGELSNQVNELQKIVTTRDEVTQQDSISRHEVNSIIHLQNQLSTNMQDVKNIVSNLGNDGIIKRETGDEDKTASEISGLRNSLEIMMENINHLVTKQQFVGKDGNKACPTPEKPNCIGPGYFVLLIVIQMVMFISYIAYKNQKEAAAKKFF